MSAKKEVKHIILAAKKDCCGCTSCYAACPKDAISMIEDEEGFKYPRIDEDKCINCGLCTRACPLLGGNKNQKSACFYAARHKQEDVVAASSSGGVFSAMAQEIIGRQGVVYGAAFDDNFTVRHIRAEDPAWTRLRGSKYVQSDMGDIFRQVKLDLDSGREVLFTGSPCQIDGLKLFLQGTNTEKLLTADLICHGVPSPGVWQNYLKFLSKKTGRSIGKINFRNKKDCGWHNSTLLIEAADGEVLVNDSHAEAFFSRLFFSHLILRPCCHSCHYANLNRAGDITIGDYWGIEKHHPELDDDKGTSLVMANTAKGREFLSRIDPACSFVPVAEKECMQANLIYPAKDFGGRETFWRTYRKYGLEIAGKRMGFLEKSLFDKAKIFGIRALDKIGSYIGRKS